MHRFLDALGPLAWLLVYAVIAPAGLLLAHWVAANMGMIPFGLFYVVLLGGICGTVAGWTGMRAGEEYGASWGLGLFLTGLAMSAGLVWWTWRIMLASTG